MGSRHEILQHMITHVDQEDEEDVIGASNQQQNILNTRLHFSCVPMWLLLK